MFGLVKLIGVSAVLAAGLVVAFDAPEARIVPDAPKLFTDRVAAEPLRGVSVAYAAPRAEPIRNAGGATATGRKGDRLEPPGTPGAPGSCATQSWPHIQASCLTESPARPARVVRHVTHESRSAAAVSVLIKVPSAELAQR